MKRRRHAAEATRGTWYALETVSEERAAGGNRWPLLLACLAFGLAYAPGIGHGFVKDDFGWIVHSRVSSLGELRELLGSAQGFYRPLVSLTFTLNEAMFGTWSAGYGITNLVFLGACVSLLYRIGRQLQLSPPAVAIATAGWAFNFHGINMALLWLSGRTSLLLTMLSLASADALLRGRRWLCGTCCLAALLSKEEAVLLPVILLIWARVSRKSLSAAVRFTWPAFAALAIYAVLRANAEAYTPTNAPAYYRFSFGVASIARNIAEYADRSLTLQAAIVIALLLYARAVRPLSAVERQSIVMGATWWVLGFAVTVWVPVRSSLYAVFPSVGVALMSAALISMAFDAIPVRSQRRAAVVLALLALVLVPVYWSRNERWVELADLTAATFAAIDAASPPVPSGAVVELLDDPTMRANFASAFGALYPEAAVFKFDQRVQLWIEPPPPELRDAAITRPSANMRAQFALRNGTVARVN